MNAILIRVAADQRGGGGKGKEPILATPASFPIPHLGNTSLPKGPPF